MHPLLAAALTGAAAPALAGEKTNWPNYREGDFVIADYTIASTETLPPRQDISRGTESLQTHRWRKADSNLWYRGEQRGRVDSPQRVDRSSQRDRRFADSLLEEAGFEPSQSRSEKSGRCAPHSFPSLGQLERHQSRTGTRGSNPSPSRAESGANLTSSTRDPRISLASEA